MTDHDAYAAAAAWDLTNPDGTTLLLLLHGLGGDRQQALGLVEGFSYPDVAVLAPDLRAHGDTSIVGEAGAFTFDAMAGDIIALLGRLGLRHKPVYVAGVSMGAALALRLAMDGHLDVRGLALVRPAMSASPNPANLASLPLVARLLRERNTDEAMDVLIASPEYQAIAAVSDAGARSVREQLEKPLARERAIRLEAVAANVAFLDFGDLRKIDVPVLVVGADRDPMHPIALARQHAAMLPNARLVEVPPRDVDAAGYQARITGAIRAHLGEVLGQGG